MTSQAFLIDAVRTPFGRHKGGLSGVRTDDLAAAPLVALLKRHPDLDPALIEDIILGDANGAGEDNRNVARMAALLAGLPATVPGVTVNRLCAAGAEAIVQASRAVRAGDNDLVIAGGVESMSRAPFVMAKPDAAFPGEAKLWNTQLGWRMVNPLMPDAWTVPLGVAAQQVAHEFGIGREAQDAWALRSQQRAAAAWAQGRFDDRVFEVAGVTRDESVRPDTSAAALARLRPAFTPDGAVTAGNSSPVNDGAAATLVGSAAAVERLGVQPLGRIVASTVAGVSPERFSTGPVPAIRALLAKAKLGFDDIAAWELNEAFAAMVLSCLHELPEIDPELVNVDGGAIAYGHPLGASAPRVVMDLCHTLRRRGGGYGIAAACIGVGQGQAVLVHVE
ncbi:thiolase family protein [Catellatospora citrea]|uniref:Acetyl-CoA acyltransferase n=1 Tax=Catellatospora citrea TaxID=53366 RepID=A0A8J3KUC2_9ACTN|nr:acetyl-CoA C-acyltransferase [Catellatospora citrea]RKE08520.1 acetyl-CoA acyltransferase [Catellatospora citrea]GIG01395.1 acetyl-CoA acyltransferase [Catellatospora citrea]